VCIVCGVSFYQKIDLKIHSLQHTGSKQHECTFCKRKFKQAAHLKYHLHSHLKQINETANLHHGFSNDASSLNIKTDNDSNLISNDNNNNISKTTEDDDDMSCYNDDSDDEENDEDIDIDDNSEDECDIEIGRNDESITDDNNKV
jgi:hypothetical protein